MILGIRHKGLRRFYETGASTGLQTLHIPRLRMLLAALETACTIRDMDVPGFQSRQLKGKLKGRWAISVSGKWRLTFEFINGDIDQLDYEDYH